ncbi:flagellar hook assembly protein FlgD [Mucilaginibacter arboris]|uniref:FlgD Ig-like domain-containing protein n=1 Tax=Mucilaginibacter arboris TaxID=2682090 RepID=A0A7K1SUV3_9SPHI|nr:hypothetical protein [Mucilaginibacter arboris]MVN21122.1 hypothetical protein [Mucilaginibacter arboris]
MEKLIIKFSRLKFKNQNYTIKSLHINSIKTFCVVLLSFIFVSLTVKAQQVTNVGCCVDIGTKATIIINGNSTASTAASTSLVNNTTVNGGFDFKLDAAANTSAGVYDANGVLVRTLWSGVHYDASCYHGQWDGYLDDGATLAPVGIYTVKIVSNNIAVTWEGTVGNTSLNLTGPYIHKGYFPMQCIALTSDKFFYGSGYSEAQSANHFGSLNNIQVRGDALNGNTTQSTYLVATDGTKVYWGGMDANSGTGTDSGRNNMNLFVFGTDLNNNQVSFSSGQPYQTNASSTVYKSIIGLTSSGTYNAALNGLSVQQSGNFLFLSFNKLNRLLILNKNTGATVQDLTISNIGYISCDYSGNVWIGTATSTPISSTFGVTQSANGKITKYTVNSSTGAITPTTTVINNYTIYKNGTNLDVEQFAISPTTGELALTDVVTEQIKFYNTATGALNSTLGQAGGYASGPAVTYDKYMMVGFMDGTKPFIAYQPDGSFWFGDIGNFRTLHFNADKTYKEQIAYLGRSRAVTIDMNDPARIFANFSEFRRDYSKPLAGTNGSWALANNWYYGLTAAQSNASEAGFYQVATVNGHTYANLCGGGPGIIELTSTGLRNAYPDGNRFDSNLNLYYGEPAYGNGQTSRTYRKLRTGFDGSNNPTYASGYYVFTTAPATINQPGYGTTDIRVVNSTLSKWIYWKGTNYEGFHLGSIKAGGTTWEWLATPSTFTSYSGSYPLDGTLDIGNTKNNDNADAIYVDNLIFWHDHGEFYKGGSEQPNMWNLFSDNGLLLQNFGEEIRSPGGVTAGVWEAGNSYSGAVSKNGNNYTGVYCDESYHSGVGEFTISNTASISTQTVAVTVSLANPITPYVDATYLMADVPYKNTTYAGSQWVFSPSTFDGNWNVKTSILSYKKQFPDLYVYSNTQFVNKTASRSLGTNNTNNWTLTGKIAWVGLKSYQNANNTNVQVLDAAGKVIANLTVKYDPPNNYVAGIVFNGTTVHSGTNGELTILTQPLQDFSIKNVNGIITFSYAGYTYNTSATFDNSANKSTPAKFTVNLNDNNAVITISELHFKAI